MDLETTGSLEIPHDTLHLRVSDRLRELLIEGVIAPGTKLNERVLCEKLGVSRTPLRESIRLLAAEGLVSHSPGRGAYAVQLSAQEVANTFDVIATLEGLAGELAARHITANELIEIRALQFELQACFERRDLPGYYRLNARIHGLLADATRNPVLKATWARLNASLHTFRFRSNQNEAKWVKAMHEHAQMIELLQKRDGAALRHLMIEHLNRKRDVVLAQLRGGAEGSDDAEHRMTREAERPDHPEN
jgi:DNA-binding GntR family transcriptional regulator